MDAARKLLPARAWVTAGDRQLFTPDTPATPYAKDHSFSCDGAFSYRLSPGRVEVHVEKGKEWLPVEREVRLKAGQTNRVTVALRRWIDMPA